MIAHPQFLCHIKNSITLPPSLHPHTASPAHTLRPPQPHTFTPLPPTLSLRPVSPMSYATPSPHSSHALPPPLPHTPSPVRQTLPCLQRPPHTTPVSSPPLVCSPSEPGPQPVLPGPEGRRSAGGPCCEPLLLTAGWAGGAAGEPGHTGHCVWCGGGGGGSGGGARGGGGEGGFVKGEGARGPKGNHECQRE